MIKNKMDRAKSTFFSIAFTIIALLSYGQEKPNIVWLVTEDNSTHFLKHYNSNGAEMPNVEWLAANGLTFNHAFSNAPVCSVARSTIISGSYAPRTGTQYHRRAALAPLPDGLEMFPYYLRQAGYYTSNNSKEDYNYIKSDKVWDESSRKASYNKRREGQPFFHIQNFGVTHEGQLHFKEDEMVSTKSNTNPAEITPFPYHPNTETFRYTYARSLDNHRTADILIGDFLDQLREDGLIDNTIIFYYGDHGGVLPRSKGYIYESGLHVPMVVYFPDKWKQLAPAKNGSRLNGFVQFIDLAPTVLNLAGANIPGQIDGKAFLGKDISIDELESRDMAFSYADRFDEKYDLVRAVRKGRYKYIRNYQPFNFDGLQNNYRYIMMAFEEWRQLYHAGKLNVAQSEFFESRPAEALYDINNDPHEINNLADLPQHQNTLRELRQQLQDQVKSISDLSFIPEPDYVTQGIDNPVVYGNLNKAKIAKLVDIADLNLLPFSKAKKKIKKAIKSKDPWQRYWGLIACTSFGNEASKFYKKAKKIVRKDKNNLVKTRAIEFLAMNKQLNPQEDLIQCIKDSQSEVEANLILNTLTLLRDNNLGYSFKLDESILDDSWISNKRFNVARRKMYINGEL